MTTQAPTAPRFWTKSPLPALRNAGLLVVALLTLMPFAWALSTSFKTSETIVQWPPEWIPTSVTLDHYRTVLDSLNFGRLFLNSLFISLSITTISLLLNALGGYVFAKFEFFGKRPMFLLFLVTMMVPAQVSLIPIFLLLKGMGLLNNPLALILPGAMSVFGVFLMRQYISTIPDAYGESARIDGCGEFRVFWSIILPLARPALGALAILTFTTAWSDFLLPLIVLQKETLYTLPVGLANLNGREGADWGILMAGAMVTILPIAVVFFALQRWILDNVTVGGLKG